MPQAIRKQREAENLRDKKGRILVVLTGGTIGSSCSDGVRGISDDSPYILMREFRRAFPDYAACEFDVVNPYSILSENLTCGVWSTLYRTLYNALDGASESSRDHHYDGVIVTHGSDTLAYTAAALGMLMRHTSLPVVLTAADRPANDPTSNALPNFRASVDFVLGAGLKGVFVSYRRNYDGAQTMYIATRLLSADCYLDEFSSYGGGCFGVMSGGRFIPEPSPVNPDAGLFNRTLSPIAGSGIDLNKSRIMLLRSYPGMDYSAVNPEGFAAVINYGYHCATACAEGEHTSLLRFAGRCGERGAHLWLSSFKRGESEIYSSQTETERLGIGRFYDMSPEAAYVKAVLAYNLPFDEPDEFMRDCVYYEMPGYELSERSRW
jgi:L-asparaginase/archaeal Glu-tRNAGln amidotransferase subunit D